MDISQKYILNSKRNGVLLFLDKHVTVTWPFALELLQYYLSRLISYLEIAVGNREYQIVKSTSQATFENRLATK